MTRAPEVTAAGDPHEVLGLAPGASAEEVQAAYLRLVREYPPERAPARFEQIRDARATLQDPWRRARHLLRDADPALPLASLLDSALPPRRFVGPAPWLSALREGARRRG